MRYLVLVAAAICGTLGIYGFIEHNFYGAAIGTAMCIVNLINYGSYLKNSHETVETVKQTIKNGDGKETVKEVVVEVIEKEDKVKEVLKKVVKEVVTKE